MEESTITGRPEGQWHAFLEMEETRSSRVWELRGSWARQKDEWGQFGSHRDRPGERLVWGTRQRPVGHRQYPREPIFTFWSTFYWAYCVWGTILETEENTMSKINGTKTFSLLPSLCAQIYMTAVLITFLSSQWDYWSFSLPLKFIVFLNFL